jgi:subtilisin-like proprotein convertase family protein
MTATSRRTAIGLACAVVAMVVSIVAAPTVAAAAAPCGGTNNADYTIPGNTYDAAWSPITISGCGRAPSATSTVEVHIKGQEVGTLAIYLAEQNHILHELKWNTFDSATTLDTTYTINLSSLPANQTWSLVVYDTWPIGGGYIDSWTLTL